MNRLEAKQLHITEHAHKQYCQRVEHIAYDQLYTQCLEQIKRLDYRSNKDNFIHLAGIWWYFNIEEETMHFITCYGKTEWDIPKGLKWANRFQDRLDLKQLVDEVIK